MIITIMDMRTPTIITGADKNQSMDTSVIQMNKKILILAGTGDAKSLCQFLHNDTVTQGCDIVASVVSSNAAGEYRKSQIPVREGAMDLARMNAYLKDENISVIIDATHPFAAEISRNAMQAADDSGVNYIRYERPASETGIVPSDFIIPDENDNLICAENHEQAADLVLSLRKKLGRDLTVMLATGAKSLEFYSGKLLPAYGINIVARLLPTVENLELCARCKIPQSNIMAMQGPFSVELNRELFLKYRVDVLISKESGSAGSTEEKILAASGMGIKTILVNRPEIQYKNLCRSFEEVRLKLAEVLQEL